MQFDLMHLSLLARERELFDSKVAQRREPWLREVFSDKIRFTHRGNVFYYVPDPDTPDGKTGLVVGRIVREMDSAENEPPEKGAREIHRPIYKGSLFLLDPTDHDEGQRAAIHHIDKIGQPISLMTSLASTINTGGDPRPPYVMEVAPISDARSFWEFVAQNEGAGITSVVFDLVTPNMFDGPEAIAEDMKALRDEEKAKRVRLGLESPDGLKLHTKRIESVVDYASKGGGRTVAKARNKKKYDSKGRIKRVPVPEPQSNEEKSRLAEILQSAKGLIFTIFGKQ